MGKGFLGLAALVVLLALAALSCPLFATPTPLPPTPTFTPVPPTPTPVPPTPTFTPVPTPTFTPVPTPTFTPVPTATKVGGILSSNTTWTRANSPYEIVDTVQIPSGVTLTIEPGVTVTRPTAGDMFLVHGTIYAHGTLDNRITFDGGGNSNFFSGKGSNANTLVDLEYSVIKNGGALWPATGSEQYGSLSLRRSEISNLSTYSYIWYPGKDVYIEYNKFTSTPGFSIGHRGSVKVYVRYNLFKGKRPGAPYVIQNWASYDQSKTIVQYNSFLDMEGIVLQLSCGGYIGASPTAMTATENYWGTIVPDAMIYDKKDDSRCWEYIEYLPILNQPHTNTPQ